MLRFLLPLAFLAGCGTTGKHAPSEGTATDRSQELAAKRSEKLKAAAFTPELYADPKDCDWTLWAGKAAAAGVQVSMDLVEYAPGEIHRRPKDQGECYPAESKSTVSNDQITGYVGARFRARDLDALKRLQAYAEAHNLVMGQPIGELGSVVLKEPLIVLIDRMIAKLSGAKEPIDPAPDYTAVSDDYAQHIQVLQIVYHGEAHGSVTDQMLQRLGELAGAFPENATFAAALAVYSGSYDKAMDLLLTDGAPLPSYVRGENPGVYREIEWLWAADLVLRHFPNKATP